MEVQQTPLEGCLVLQPRVFPDERGYFLETFNENQFKKATGITTPFVQDNQSHSRRGVLRALHYQVGDFAQAKLVRVAKGKVLDVAVDLRKDSPTFGQHHSVLLDDQTHTQFYIPRGFAHGFVVLSEEALFCYKCDNFYHKESEAGIVYNDATLNIDWHLPEEDLIISERDRGLPPLEQARL